MPAPETPITAHTWPEFQNLPMAEKVRCLAREDGTPFHTLFAQQFDRANLDRLCKLATEIRTVAKSRGGMLFLQSLLSHKRAMLYFTQPSSRTFLSFLSACQIGQLPRIGLSTGSRYRRFQQRHPGMLHVGAELLDPARSECRTLDGDCSRWHTREGADLAIQPDMARRIIVTQHCNDELRTCAGFSWRARVEGPLLDKRFCCIGGSIPDSDCVTCSKQL